MVSAERHLMPSGVVHTNRRHLIRLFDADRRPSDNDLMTSEKRTPPRVRKARLIPHEEFYAAVGRFVLTWADLEVCLDLLLLKARSRHDSTQRKSKIPYQFTEKISFIRLETKDLGSTQ
jgi:hypothetical protein